MPRAPRRSRREKKVLVNWVPAFNVVLNQGYFTLTDLIALYQTSKIVQTLFTAFSLKLYVDYGYCEPFHVPDNATWCKIFKSFKTKSYLSRRSSFGAIECVDLISGLVICGYVDLASDIYKQFTIPHWRLDVGDAILANGSKFVYEQCSQRFACLDPTWLEEHDSDPDWLEEKKQHDIPPVPLFSSSLAELVALWEWFRTDHLIHYTDLAKFILDIGQLRSTVALDYLVSSLHSIVFKKASPPDNTITLRDVLLDHDTASRFRRLKESKKLDLLQIYGSWDNSNAREFIAQVVVPLKDYLEGADNSE